MRRSLLALTLLLSLLAPTPGQTEKRAQESNEEDSIVRINTSLVQIDVVVTDKNGRQVTDLKPEDFEILENGKRQTITNFSYVALQPDAQTTVVNPPSSNPSIPVKPARIRPEQVRRTFALVVDDLGLSFASIDRTKKGLREFVDKQMQPGDLVAILRTSGGSGALQQYTNDKQQLHAAINSIKFGLGRVGIDAFEAIDRDRDRPAGAIPVPMGENVIGRAAALEDERKQFFIFGTLGTLTAIVTSMAELPGRKAVVLFSDGFVFQGRDNRTQAAVKKLVEQANRAAVVFYPIGARPPQSLALTASDDYDVGSDQATTQVEEREANFFDTMKGLQTLAAQTSGRYSDDISSGLKRVVDEEKGFYLIGYDPDEANFTPERRDTFHTLTVKVKRSGLRTRTRSGFYGFTDEVARTERRSIAQALNSPFQAGALALKLSALFNYDESEGASLRSLLHIDTNNLTFTREADGRHKTVFDVVAVTYGSNGEAIDQSSKTHTILVRDDALAHIKQDGLVVIFTVPLKAAGAYQVKTVVRDSASQRVGCEVREDALTTETQRYT